MDDNVRRLIELANFGILGGLAGLFVLDEVPNKHLSLLTSGIHCLSDYHAALVIQLLYCLDDRTLSVALNGQELRLGLLVTSLVLSSLSRPLLI